MALTTLLEKVKANLCRILHSVLCLHNAWVLICLYITAAIFYDLYDRLFSVCGHVFLLLYLKKAASFLKPQFIDYCVKTGLGNNERL